MEKVEKLLEEELDILRIIKSVRQLKKEDENKFMIDITVQEDNPNFSNLANT